MTCARSLLRLRWVVLTLAGLTACGSSPAQTEPRQVSLSSDAGGGLVTQDAELDADEALVFEPRDAGAPARGPQYPPPGGEAAVGKNPLDVIAQLATTQALLISLLLTPVASDETPSVLAPAAASDAPEEVLSGAPAPASR